MGTNANTEATSYGQKAERQLAAWKKLGVAISDEARERILQQADAFQPFTDSDEPLVTGGFGYDGPTCLVNRFFTAFEPPKRYTKATYLEEAEFRYAPGHKPKGGLRLVHYDPNAYPGLSPEMARSQAKTDKLRLAGIEVFEHLVLEPRSGLTWDGEKNLFPDASGLDRKYNGAWSDFPYLGRWDNDRQFRLFSSGAGCADERFSSPTVRECD